MVGSWSFSTRCIAACAPVLPARPRCRLPAGCPEPGPHLSGSGISTAAVAFGRAHRLHAAEHPRRRGTFPWMHGSVPPALALALAIVGVAILAMAVGEVRVRQRRRLARRHLQARRSQQHPKPSNPYTEPSPASGFTVHGWEGSDIAIPSLPTGRRGSYLSQVPPPVTGTTAALRTSGPRTTTIRGGRSGRWSSGSEGRSVSHAWAASRRLARAANGIDAWAGLLPSRS